jgi:hypothetical protein
MLAAEISQSVYRRATGGTVRGSTACCELLTSKFVRRVDNLREESERQWSELSRVYARVEWCGEKCSESNNG